MSLDRVASGGLLVSLGLLSIYGLFGRRVAERVIPPIRVYEEAVTEDLWLLAAEGTLTLGPDSAADTMVIFTDYECPYCRMAESVVEELIASESLLVVYRHFPINTHPTAWVEAIAVECGARSGRMREVQNIVFEESGVSWTPRGLASALPGLEEELLRTCWASPQTTISIVEDLQLADALKLTGTPGVLLSGRRLSHLPTADEIRELLR